MESGGYGAAILPLVILVAWSWGFYRLGRRAERRAKFKKPATDRQVVYIQALCEELGIDPPVPKSMAEASQMIDELKSGRYG